MMQFGCLFESVKKTKKKFWSKMGGILFTENMNFIKKRISIIDIALFKIGHYMAFICYLVNANNTTSVFREYKVLMGF